MALYTLRDQFEIETNIVTTEIAILECPEAVAGISAGYELTVDMESGRIDNLTHAFPGLIFSTLLRMWEWN